MPRLATALCLVALPALAASCGVSDRCLVSGVTATCDCGGGMRGARVCGEDHIWLSCDCNTAIGLPNPITDEPEAATSGGGTGGAGGAAGTPPAGGSGGGPPVGGDDDGGMDVGGSGGAGGDTGGTGGMGGTGGGGTGGSGGAGGSGGMEPEPPLEDPYRPCAATADCPSGECVITPGFPASLSVCAPDCVDVGDCPVPEGSFEATPVCDAGYCKLDCAAVLFQPLRTCPTGMVCVSTLFGAAHCHDDGM